jgi:poly(3-hydroxybutyrate) depolymerase
MPSSRRPFLQALATMALAPIACRRSVATTDTMAGSGGRLKATNSAGRSGAYYLCADRGTAARPLLVFTHGTDGTGEGGVALFRASADARHFHIVAPDSRISPQGQATWEVGDHPGDITPDFTHVLACVDELLGMPGVLVDRQRVLIAGHSGGASTAPYLATNDDRFSAFAILHGGVFMDGLGGRAARGWISTGEGDTLRGPQEIESHAAALRGAGYDVTRTIFPGGHEISEAESAALMTWWLGA